MGIFSRMNLEKNNNDFDREDSKTKTSSKNFKKYDKDYEDFKRKYKHRHPNIEPKSSENQVKEDEIDLDL